MGMLNQLLGAAGDIIKIAFITPTSVVVGVTATASFTIANDGDIDATATNNTIADRDDWIAPKQNMALYEVRATLQSGGPLTSGTMGSYLSLGTSRTWTLAQAPVGNISAVVRFEFRLIGSSTIIYTVDVTFNAQAS